MAHLKDKEGNNSLVNSLPSRKLPASEHRHSHISTLSERLVQRVDNGIANDENRKPGKYTLAGVVAIRTVTIPAGAIAPKQAIPGEDEGLCRLRPLGSVPNHDCTRRR